MKKGSNHKSDLILDYELSKKFKIFNHAFDSGEF